MHSLILAQRTNDAIARIRESAEVIAERQGIENPAQRVGVGRMPDGAHRRLADLEALAEFLSVLAPTVTPSDARPYLLLVDGITEAHLPRLAAAGIRTLGELDAADDTTLLSVEGIGPATVQRIRQHLAVLTDNNR